MRGASVTPIIGAPGPVPSGPAVRHLRVGPEWAGQRLDNFLLRELKGVPKTLVYRIIGTGTPSLKGKRYYLPSDQGQEAKIKENHDRRDKLRNGEPFSPVTTEDKRE